MEEIMKELFGIEMTDKDFDDLMVAELQGKQLKVINNKVVAVNYEPTQEEIVHSQIYELKQKLAQTDYQAIKYAEGELPYSEYEPVRKQRREWRAEINRLEAQLNG